MAVNFPAEEKDQLPDAFQRLDVKPDFQDPDALKQWKEEYLQTQHVDPNPGAVDPDAGQAELAGASDDERADDVDPYYDAEENRPPLRRNHRYIQAPRVVPFSGSGDSKEILYESWKYEV